MHTVTGQIRASTGKAQLLIAQRFRQFRGLVDDCEFKTGARETTCDDLQGFWDMVYVQVSGFKVTTCDDLQGFWDMVYVQVGVLVSLLIFAVREEH